MRRVISWLLAGLPFDARSRRAIDETLLDWEGEVREAKTAWERTVTELRGVASIARVTSLSVVRESVDFSWLRGLGRRFVVAGGVIMALALVLSATATREFALNLRMLLWFVPMLATMALPATLFLIIAWRPSGRCVPSLGASWITGITAVLVIQLVTALAVELFYFLMYQDLGIERPSSSPREWPRFMVLAVVGFGSVVGSTAVLAGSLARRESVQSRWWLVGIPVLSLIVPGGAQVVIRTALGYAGLTEYRVFSDLAVSFGLAAVLLVLAAKFGSRVIPAGESNA
jgi:hypothetical protein